MEIGIRDVLRALKPCLYVFYQIERGIQQNRPANGVGIRRGGNRRHRAALTRPYQENIPRIRNRLLLHHVKHRFQIGLLGENEHLQAKTITAAICASAAEIKAVDHIAFRGKGIHILRPDLIVSIYK